MYAPNTDITAYSSQNRLLLTRLASGSRSTGKTSHLAIQISVESTVAIARGLTGLRSLKVSAELSQTEALGMKPAIQLSRQTATITQISQTAKAGRRPRAAWKKAKVQPCSHNAPNR